jgi:hypothetical protein
VRATFSSVFIFDFVPSFSSHARKRRRHGVPELMISAWYTPVPISQNVSVFERSDGLSVVIFQVYP